MEGKNEEERICYEMGVVVPKRIKEQISEGYGYDCVQVLIDEFSKIGFVVDTVIGLHDEFLKLAAPVEVIGKAAVELKLKKRTQIGVDLQFEWDEAEAFIKEADGSLFSWCERFRCYNHMIYGIVNRSESAVILKSNCRDVRWEPGESLLWKLEKEAIVKEVFPIHDETKRKHLLKHWALNWWDFTNQPLDEIYAYYGAKIATYFAFLGMYTKWLFFPAAFGLLLQLVDFGSLQLFVLPFFFVCVVSWAVFFLQFWKRKNSTLLARWQICYSVGAESAYKYMDTEWSSFHSSPALLKKPGTCKANEKEKFQREEWFGHMTRFRNDAIIILSIICLQLPFELAYAHLYESIESDIMKFGLTAVYLFAIQYFTQMGGRVSVKLIKHEQNENSEYRANSLIYKVFGLYFMQSYIGLLYHAILHRNFMTLRQVIIQRLIISEVLENLMENSLPYVKYSYRKYRAVRNKKKRDTGMAARKSYFNSRVEKEFFKPVYSASIGDELEDGLFDEFLELALQFGMIMMFACAFPPAFAFAALNNITEIRADALKILAMYRRPVPRVAATIGAWLNIFQIHQEKSMLFGTWGGNGGNHWDDGVHDGIREITLVYSSCIDSICLTYDNNFKPLLAEKHGGMGGTKSAQIKLRFPEEVLISVSGHCCPVVYRAGPVIRSLTFKTNKRTYGPFGVEEGTPFNFLTNVGHIVGLYGRSGWFLDSLGFYVSPPKPTLFQRIQIKCFGFNPYAIKDGKQSKTKRLERS